MILGCFLIVAKKYAVSLSGTGDDGVKGTGSQAVFFPAGRQ
jgi:hypothetical protein